MVCIPEFAVALKALYLIRLTGLPVLCSFRGSEQSRLAWGAGHRRRGGEKEQGPERNYTAGCVAFILGM